MRVAAVDCGTNSLRLLISEVKGDAVKDIYRSMEIVRLGEGVDATGAFADTALERFRGVLSRFAEIMVLERVSDLRMVATSASRDVSNRDQFVDITSELLGRVKTGSAPEVISGDEEARLSFSGAIHDLRTQPSPFCVIDLGGGSTEFIIGDAEGNVSETTSRQMGCVRLTERFLASDPPAFEEIEAARAYVRSELEQVNELLPISSVRTFIGCAGSFTTLSALAQGLEQYEPAAIHTSVLRFDGLRVLISELLASTVAQRSSHPVIHEGRADVLLGGVLVTEGIMDLVSEQTPVREFIVSERDILDGLIQQLARRHSDND